MGMREAKKDLGCNCFDYYDVCRPFCLGGAELDSSLPHTAQSRFIPVRSDLQHSSHRRFFSPRAVVLSPVDFRPIYYHVSERCAKLRDSCS